MTAPADGKWKMPILSSVFNEINFYGLKLANISVIVHTTITHLFHLLTQIPFLYTCLYIDPHAL